MGSRAHLGKRKSSGAGSDVSDVPALRSTPPPALPVSAGAPPATPVHEPHTQTAPCAAHSFIQTVIGCPSVEPESAHFSPPLPAASLLQHPLSPGAAVPAAGGRDTPTFVHQLLSQALLEWPAPRGKACTPHWSGPCFLPHVHTDAVMTGRHVELPEGRGCHHPSPSRTQQPCS